MLWGLLGYNYGKFLHKRFTIHHLAGPQKRLHRSIYKEKIHSLWSIEIFTTWILQTKNTQLIILHFFSHPSAAAESKKPGCLLPLFSPTLVANPKKKLTPHTMAVGHVDSVVLLKDPENQVTILRP
jgi:hypothetical protein